jgi:hypothetical protein
MSDEENISEGQDQDSPAAELEGQVPRPYGMPGGEVGDSFTSAARLLDAIDKQNKRLAEIRDAVAGIDWSSIRLAGLGFAGSGEGTWVQSWEVGDAREG